jgi:methionyl aminopeptidase
MAIIVKTAEEIRLMREAGKILATILQTLVEQVRPGIKTGELDRLFGRELVKFGARSSFKGYRGFPACICTSVNEEVVHGIPGDRVLCDGDVLSLDAGIIYKGFQGDAAVTVGVGEISDEAKHLITVTEGALQAGIEAARHNSRLGDVSAAIQQYVESRGLSVVREYTGHGIGRQMHEDPQIPNYGNAGEGPVLTKGMTLALEPMVNAGVWNTCVKDDHWTVLTADGKLSAHFEHTIAITNGKAEILTAV